MRCKGDWHAVHISAYTCACGHYSNGLYPARKADPDPFVIGYSHNSLGREPVTNNETYTRGYEMSKLAHDMREGAK